ncbi:MAG: DEAD/DEAH box helicase, partial [Candidatus Brocadiaceae bacterium]
MGDAEQQDRDQRRVAVVALNLPVDKTFDYLIPEKLRGKVEVGARVRVPFGNRKGVLGYCVGLRARPTVPEHRLKPLARCLDREPLFTPSMLKLARWIADYYHCALGEALHAALPASVRGGRQRRKLQFAQLQMPPEEATRLADEIFDRSPAQSRILRALAEAGGEAPLVEILKSTSTTRSSSNALRRRDQIGIEKRTVQREDALSELSVEPQEPYRLTPEQRAAYRTVADRLERGRFDVVLLHGITSSGKTEVYMHCIADVVGAGKQAIVLVPEISLTPQTVRRFGSRFQRLAVLHSHLTDAERRDQWQKIRHGKADVVIGARSAVFAPVPALGLVVIDEEHENSFKQDSTPRYHARDVGIMRARWEDALVVLGSATPSLE